MGIRSRTSSIPTLVLVFAMMAAVFLLGVSARPGRQNPAILPALVLARLRLYGKVPILY